MLSAEGGEAYLFRLSVTTGSHASCAVDSQQRIWPAADMLDCCASMPQLFVCHKANNSWKDGLQQREHRNERGRGGEGGGGEKGKRARSVYTPAPCHISSCHISHFTLHMFKTRVPLKLHLQNLMPAS
jgi:hypothetical protein